MSTRSASTRRARSRPRNSRSTRSSRWRRARRVQEDAGHGGRERGDTEPHGRGDREGTAGATRRHVRRRAVLVGPPLECGRRAVRGARRTRGGIRIRASTCWARRRTSSRTWPPDADPDGLIDATTTEWAKRGLRVLLLARSESTDGFDPAAQELPRVMEAIGLVSLSDVLRPDVMETLGRFQQAGVTVRVISGDDPETVAALARQAGLDVGPAVANGATSSRSRPRAGRGGRAPRGSSAA